VSDHFADPVLGKIVLDFSRKYVSVYLCEGSGAIKDFDHFKYPFRLDTKDARGECRDTYDWLYQYLNDSINAEWELQEDGDAASDSTDGGAA
jgi:hypothetical protein